MPKAINSPAGVLLCSGGMDSTTLAYYLHANGVQFNTLFFDYGQHCTETEYRILKEVVPESIFGPLTVIRLSDIYGFSSSKIIVEPDLWVERVEADDLYLPYRNLLLLSAGAAFAQSIGATSMYSAFINSNHAKEIDCSAEFFGRLRDLLSSYGSVSLEMPFRNLSKYEVAKIGLELHAPIASTFSCQAASKVPCGACPNCVDRLEAFLRIANECSNEETES